MKKLNPLLKRLLGKPEEDRLEIATQLFQSVEHQIDPEIDKAWRVEIRKRVKEMQKGQRKWIPWSVVRARLRKQLHAA